MGPPDRERAEQAFVLVPHEPTLDPRVHYTAESLTKKYAVTVVAVVQEFEARPEANRPNAGYVTVRLPYAKHGALKMCHAFLALWARKALGDGWFARTASSVAAMVLLVVLCGLTLPFVGLAIALELFLLPAVLVGEQRLVVLPLMSRAGRKLGRTILRVLGLRPPNICLLDMEGPYRGVRVTASVLRFTFSSNYLLWRFMAEQHQVPAVVYCHDLYTLQTGVMLKQRSAVRLIYDSHEYYPYQYSFWHYAPVIRFYEAALVRAVDAYITVTPQLAEELTRTYRVRRVHTIPNVEPCPSPRPGSPVSRMAQLAKGRLRLLYQGSFAEDRGLEEVLREWSHVDGTKIALFLRGPRNSSLEHLERLAEELELLGRSVYVLPAVLEKDLIGAAQEADIGLVPYKGDRLSYRFAGPNKLSQYIHAGLVILGNSLPYVEQVIGRGRCGLCYDVRNRGSFATAVDSLVSDRARVELFKKNTQTFSQAEYNWEKYEPTLLNLVGGVKVV